MSAAPPEYGLSRNQMPRLRPAAGLPVFGIKVSATLLYLMPEIAAALSVPAETQIVWLTINVGTTYLRSRAGMLPLSLYLLPFSVRSISMETLLSGA